MTHTKNSKQTLVPKLRFPEFQGSRDWDLKEMGVLYSFKGNNSLSRDKLVYDGGSIKNIHYGDIHTKFSTHFYTSKETVPYINPSEPVDKIKGESFCIEGDMIFADASEDLDDIGKSIEIIELNKESLVAGQHTILARRKKSYPALGFGGHLFKSKIVRIQIQKESQGAKVLGISPRRLAKITLPIPCDKTEQQKIADCLGSLDELITAQREKLATLQEHKKGLLQKLFPAEGQTTPELRFPGFEGEWEEKNFLKTFDVQDGFAFSSNDFIEKSCNSKQVIRITDINNKNKNADKVFFPISKEIQLNLSRYIARKGDLLLSLTGAAGFNFYIWEGEDSYLNQRTARITPKNKKDRLLVRLLEPLIYEKINNRGEGQNNNLTRGFLATVTLIVPIPEEQQKIASCLSALDDLISAQTAEIEALQQHKQGLMQQLFPNPEDSAA